MRKITQWSSAGSLVIGVSLTLAGCRVPGLGGPAPEPSTGPPVMITQKAVPSALVLVLAGPAPGASVAGLVSATARAREDLAVLLTGEPPQIVVSSTAPAPPVVKVGGRPAASSGDETTFQKAQHADQVKHWHEQVAAGWRTEDARLHAALLGWQRGIDLLGKIGHLGDPPGRAGNLAGESKTAASAMAGLEEENGNVFGHRRVIVMYTSDLAGRPPAGELTGDTVLVITPYLPASAAASAAQVGLLAAGAARAAVVGPEITSAQIAALVSGGLSKGGGHDSVSSPVLFANASAALSRRAVSQLTALLPQLRGAGVTAVLNGFASVPGTALSNYKLSYRRAAAVAAFFEAHGIPAASLIIVGHGSHHLTKPGRSGQNRRVTVVIERP